MEFEVEGFVSFSEDERKKICGSRGRYINFVLLWIKMLLYEKRIILMENDTMVGQFTMHCKGGGRPRDMMTS